MSEPKKLYTKEEVDAIITNKDAIITNKDAIITNKDAIITNKDAIIADLQVCWVQEAIRKAMIDVRSYHTSTLTRSCRVCV
jgi:hypothetical protein